MVSDIDQLIQALHSDPPEQMLKDEIRRRRGEIVARLRQGKTFEMRDFRGRIIRISPRRSSSDSLPGALIENQPA